MTKGAPSSGSAGALAWLGTMAKRVADWIGVALFLSAFMGFLVQVFYRYVLNAPLLWTQEFVMISFIWAVFWSAAFTVPIRKHVSFDVVYDIVSPETRRVFSVISMVAVIAAFALLVPYTWDYLTFMARRKSAVLRIPMDLVYGCYLLFIAGFAIQGFWRLIQLFGPSWRDQI
ncbi:TRAP transporter small permease [Jiella sp. MQZ9-1]|uniref:TRAP transporter small permease protein n=1 Tax=Jiella flava TaxID=2816857 RepID=A0A939JUD9_9HYPH|nr:TRAP transporter small permease [Jiella flava]MBO0663080.1 TRAP transporter small permease [Jiella flava]MCD2471499.1 TRAP transporter small permease [Jiella flava]